MKAWVATTLDGEDGLEVQDIPSPPCGPEQVRIANHAAALNFPDVLITRGQYQLRLEPPFVPGSECAGVVSEVGSDVDVVFDPVGGALFDQARRCVGWNGRYLVIGFAAGDIPVMPANYPLLKSMSLVGVAFGMSAIKDPAMNATNFRQLFGWFGDGSLHPHVGDVVAFDDLPRACADLYAGRAIGKTVIELKQ
jgi:NADPH:quinone reductase-like Zn-dependent oxidoreductase